MSWKFWQRKEKPKPKTWEDYEAERQAKAAADKAQAKAEWDALPDHRKAARIEYAFFRDMARKPVKLGVQADQLAAWALAQQSLANTGSVNPYGSLNSAIGSRTLWG